MPPEELAIAARFNGPPGSGNGGYACGLAAGALIDGAAEVTLRRPPPIEVPLRVVATDEGGEIRQGNAVIATVSPWDGELEVPEAPSDAQISEAMRSFDLPGYAGPHPFPTCFTCGPQRDPGSGLRIFPGRGPQGPEVLWAWTPDPSLDAGDGQVSAEVMWAGLDCPGGHTWLSDESAGIDTPIVLGRLAARIDRRSRIGSRYFTMGWQLGREGRKLRSGSAIWSETGELQAVGEATWFVLDAEQAAAFTAGG